MADVAMPWRHTVPAQPFPGRRLHALLRLLRTRRRRRRFASSFCLADERMLADVGCRRDRHGDRWLAALCGVPAAAHAGVRLPPRRDRTIT